MEGKIARHFSRGGTSKEGGQKKFELFILLEFLARTEDTEKNQLAQAGSSQITPQSINTQWYSFLLIISVPLHGTILRDH